VEHLEGSCADDTPSQARGGKVDGNRRARSSPGSPIPSACAIQTGDYAYRTDGTTQMKSSAREPTSSGKRPSPSHHCEGHPWRKPRMESRMRGNSHVRFGAGDGETHLGNGARRFIPTLPKTGSALFLWNIGHPPRRRGVPPQIQLCVTACQLSRQKPGHATARSFAIETGTPCPGRKPRRKSAALLACDAARTMARLSSRSTSSQEPM